MGTIRKIEVTSGVYWVEISGAGLRILCGCPADAVKHLMLRGLVVPEEVQGVMAESGPNAILLADSLIQNGVFSNLAEFPVLQMLYRQGLILPNHPNNTGQRPLLMGGGAQVEAQMRYIYRGNYGLVSEEELVAAGMRPERAREEMRLKLRFAFGRIRSTDELLDRVTIGSGAVEVRPGVTVARRAHNVFELAHDGQSVEVDLNLAPGQTYPSPYTLGSRDIGRDYFSVVHFGDGDGWDVNRPTMASIIMFQGRIYLIDVGPNVHHNLAALGIGVNEVTGVFHTHAHDDHFCGLTTLMQADHRLQHLATPLVRASVMKKWAVLVSRPESEFAHYFEPVDLRLGRWNDIDGLRVKPVYSPHPVETTIMRFRARGGEGSRTYAHLADITSRRVMDDFLAPDDAPAGMRRARYDAVWKDYLAPADVKKIDIGGGLIHGDAEDFEDDRSEKLLLSHTATPLTGRQKEIGSQASFGMTDVLIEGKQDFVRSSAYHHLSEYLPGAKAHDLRMIMNGEMITFNAGDIIQRRGRRPRHIYMIVTGLVELLDSDLGISNSLGAGAMIGDVSGLLKRPAQATFRAKTQVRALRITQPMLAAVIRENGLDGRIELRRSGRELLQKTRLFDGLSTAVHNRVTEGMVEAVFSEGDIIAHPAAPAVFLVRQGSVDIRFGERTLETITRGGYLGEGYVLYDVPCTTIGHAVSEVRMAVIPAATVRDVPVLRWRLYETLRSRMEQLVESVELESDVFRWREELSTGVEEQDRDHRQLLERALAVTAAMRSGCGREDMGQALDGLLAVSRAHFERELAMYEREGFPELEHHRRLHRQLLRRLEEMSAKIERDCAGREREFRSFIKEWLVDHILIEDRKFGAMIHWRNWEKSQEESA